MNKWSPTQAYVNIAEANRSFYAKTAAQYDESETCLTNQRHQAMLESDLDRALAVVGKPNTEISALDACGGSGNISIKLLKRGVKTTLADISPELLEIFRHKCLANGLTAQTSCGEIGSFLAGDTEPFDLIVFSSCLHHLENIRQVLTLAFDRLTPGGLLFTVFDPTSRQQLRRITKIAQRIEYYVFKVFCQSSDLPKAIGRRLKRMLSGASADNKAEMALNESTVGLLAEYHVENGIDDLNLVEYLQQIGFEVVQHDRYVDSRFGLIGAIIRSQGDATSFKMLLRKPASVR